MRKVLLIFVWMLSSTTWAKNESKVGYLVDELVMDCRSVLQLSTEDYDAKCSIALDSHEKSYKKIKAQDIKLSLIHI